MVCSLLEYSWVWLRSVSAYCWMRVSCWLTWCSSSLGRKLVTTPITSLFWRTGRRFTTIFRPRSQTSRYQNLNELLAAVKENPKSVKFAGGSARGGWDHLKVLIAAKAAGAEKLPSVPYLSYNNGGEAMSQVVGGQVDAFTGDLSEATGFMKSGDLRVLAVLAEERLPGEFADLPTAKEQGIDAVGPNWRGFYMPKGAEEGAREYWVDALNTLYASDQWKKVMKNNGLIPFHPPAGEFEAFVQAQVKDIETLSREIGLLK